MYFDPGFGGMLLQGLVLLASVGGTILFSMRKKMRRLFSKRNTTPPGGGRHNKRPPESTQPIHDDTIDVLGNEEK